MVSLDPTVFPPLCLPALFEFEWTPILTCNLVSFPTPPLLLYMVTSKVGIATEREIGCRFGGAETGRLLELALPGHEYTRKSGYSRLPYSHAEFPIGCLS